MKLTPLHDRGRPPQATLKTWQEAGLPPSLASVLQELWESRAVGWAGLAEDDLETINRLWVGLGDVAAVADLAAWAVQARELVWGQGLPWSKIDHKGGFDEADRLWAKARLWLGEPVVRLIANDGWKTQIGQARDLATSYDDLQKRAARRHRERLTYLPSHPEPDGGWSVRRVSERARHLIRRFGFAHLRTAGGMPIEDVWSALGEAQDGLSAMARVLGVDDADLGAGRLGLSFELDMPTGLTAPRKAHFDRLTMTINLGRQGGWGSFVHEWAHAVDGHLGLHWNPNEQGSDAGLAVYLADVAHQQVFADHEATRLAWADALWPKPIPGGDVQVLRQAALQLPALLGQLRDRLPHSSWESKLDARLEAMGNWIKAVTRGEGTPMQWREGWERWKVGNVLAWGAPDDRAARRWRSQWDRVIATAERLLWSDEVSGPAWLAWSRARDAVEGARYWTLPSEMWARLVQSIVRHRIGHDTWAADNTLNVDVFPQGGDLEAVDAWWRERQDQIFQMWLADAPVPTWKRPRASA